MKVNNLQKVFEKFLLSNDRAILIDGSWGVGKTYYVLDFLKKHKKEKRHRMAYISLFGKSNLDEIHTELYSKLMPTSYNAKKIINLIPKVASVIPKIKETIGGLEYSLKTKVSSKINKRNSIVILDDFERLNFENIDFNEILGYFNSLIFQKLKLIVVCNTNEIINKEVIKKKFYSFKEKIFDREYKISSTIEEVVEAYFGEEKKLLDKNIFKELNNNLRIAHRVSDFFLKTLNLIKEINKDYKLIISNKVILWHITFVIIGANTDQYKSTKTKKQNEETLNSLVIKAEVEDKNIQGILTNIQAHFEQLEEKPFPYLNIKLLASLTKLYFYEDNSTLLIIFAGNKSLDDNPLNFKAFYFSDEGKINLFKKQINYILDKKDLKNVRLYETIRELQWYNKLSEIEKYEDEIIFTILQQKDIYEKEIGHLINFFEEDNERFKNFSKKLAKEYNECLRNDLIKKIEDSLKIKNYNETLELLDQIYTKSYCYHNDESMETLHPKLLELFVKVNYFVDCLSNEISFEYWGVAHKICDLAIRYHFDQQMIQYIDSINLDKNNFSEQERYDCLLKKLKQNK